MTLAWDYKTAHGSKDTRLCLRTVFAHGIRLLSACLNAQIFFGIISPSTPVTTIVVTFTTIVVTLLFLLGGLCGRECGSRALRGCMRRDHAVILSVYNLGVCEGLKDIHWRRHAANGGS